MRTNDRNTRNVDEAVGDEEKGKVERLGYPWAIEIREMKWSKMPACWLWWRYSLANAIWLAIGTPNWRGPVDTWVMSMHSRKGWGLEINNNNKHIGSW